MKQSFLVFSTLISLARSFLLLPLPSSTSQISADVLAAVRYNLLQSATRSWERGTAAEALTEYSWPALSVFADNPFPPIPLNATYNASDVITIATETVATKPDQILALIEDGAVGDPASIGVAVLLANWTRTDLTDTSFSLAAGEQLDYLLNHAPRTDDGAISHRSDQVQLWADFVYMAPPFIAYFGALADEASQVALLQVAYDQCRLYRNYLQDPETGLWRHVVLGTWEDTALWGTGNAWAAAGMLRVLETIRHSNTSSQFTTQQQNLTTWIEEIVNGTWIYQKENGTLYNALNDESSFTDSASTALLAAVTYRLAVLKQDSLTHIDAAEAAYRLIESSIDTGGWLKNTVDPLTFNTPSAPDGNSPEGQAFVLLLEAARRDFITWTIAQSLLS